jgi:polar amino acid transport system substrate-binding protein
MKRILIALSASLIVSTSAQSAETPALRTGAASPASMRATLAPTGTLRATFLGTNPVQGRVDPVTGVVTGPIADLVQELARRLAVPYQIIPSPDARAVIGHLKDQSVDIGFLAYDASRAAEVDFAGPFARMFNSYVVPNASLVKQSAEIDMAGQVVGAVKGQTQELFVSSHLHKARVHVLDKQPSAQEIEALFKSGEISAFAMNRQRALELDKASSELRALPDSFLEVLQEFVVLKGDAPKARLLDSFAAELRASGFVKQSLEKAGLQDSVGVASSVTP